eukprot:scaffold7713_cov31-Cyclotella_meneghiniana.AAC.1
MHEGELMGCTDVMPPIKCRRVDMMSAITDLAQIPRAAIEVKMLNKREAVGLWAMIDSAWSS